MAVKTGRNDLCQCGSGQKYKKCCMAADSGMKPIHMVDSQLRQQMMDYSKVKFKADAFAEAKSEPVPEEMLPLFIPWMLYHHPIDGQSVAQWYSQGIGNIMDERETKWLSAQQQTLISVWRVLQVTPGRDVVLEDVFTGQSRTVSDVNASRTLKPLTSLLARITDFEDYTVVTAAHPQPLTPMHAFEVQQAFMAWLGRPVQPEDLRQGPSTLQLMRLWHRRVEAGQQAAPRGLSNSDGDPLELSVVRMRFADRAAIMESLLTSERKDLVVESIGTDLLLFSRQNEPRPGQFTATVVADLTVGPDSLHMQTNSQLRAETYRTWIETASGGKAVYAETLPLDMGTYTQTLHRAAPTQQPTLDGGMEAMRLFKAQHYQAWLDEKLPVFNQQSPRQAAHTEEGRGKLQAASNRSRSTFDTTSRPCAGNWDYSWPQWALPHWSVLGCSTCCRASTMVRAWLACSEATSTAYGDALSV
jgi:hypothetical protein